MRYLGLLFVIVFIGCGGGGGAGEPASPVAPGPPTLIESAKITNFYLHIDSVWIDSSIKFQASVENTGSEKLIGAVVRFHGQSCHLGSNTIWSDLTMQEYIIDIPVGQNVTPPREGYISAYLYSMCYMKEENRPGAIYDVTVEIISNDGTILDSQTKYFNAADGGTTIGSDDYL